MSHRQGKSDFVIGVLTSKMGSNSSQPENEEEQTMTSLLTHRKSILTIRH